MMEEKIIWPRKTWMSLHLLVRNTEDLCLRRSLSSQRIMSVLSLIQQIGLFVSKEQQPKNQQPPWSPYAQNYREHLINNYLLEDQHVPLVERLSNIMYVD